MATTFEKLNFRNQRNVLVLNAPETFEPELAALRGVPIARSPNDREEIDFSIAFVTKQKEVDDFAKAIAKRAKSDAVVWFAYPKGTSKKYQSEIHRDHGWQVLRQLGFDSVRAVAIDEDWSALRFRRAEFIKPTNRGPRRPSCAQGKVRPRKK
jgi:hypothetical protein